MLKLTQKGQLQSGYAQLVLRTEDVAGSPGTRPVLAEHGMGFVAPRLWGDVALRKGSMCNGRRQQIKKGEVSCGI